MDILTALQPGGGQKIAFTGAGGKSTSMFALARLLPPPVFVTTTTHLAVSQIPLADGHYESQQGLDPRKLPAGVLLFSGAASAAERLSPAPAKLLEWLREVSENQGHPLLVEADGARMRPMKAPADHEPAVPDWCDLVVVTAGLSGLGMTLDAKAVHRPEVFAALSGLNAGAAVSPQALARVLADPLGGLKGIPPRAERVVLLNQADDPLRQAQARSMVPQLLPHYHSVLIASMAAGEVYAAHGRVAGVVLAAGGSSRLGQPKQLLDWGGQPLVRRAAAAALEAGLDPVVVVTGAAADGVGRALDGMPIQTVHNPAWSDGQSGSVRLGLAALPPRVSAAVFLLSDQPYVSGELVRQLVEKHAQTRSAIVAPLIDGKRGNPVLFDRRTFEAFGGLQGDIGARPLFSRYQAVWVPWHDPRSALDVDTPQDLEKLRGTD